MNSITFLLSSHIAIKPFLPKLFTTISFLGILLKLITLFISFTIFSAIEFDFVTTRIHIVLHCVLLEDIKSNTIIRGLFFHLHKVNSSVGPVIISHCNIF